MRKVGRRLSALPEAIILLADAILIIIAIPAFAFLDGVLPGRFYNLDPVLLFALFWLVVLHLLIAILAIQEHRQARRGRIAKEIARESKNANTK